MTPRFLMLVAAAGSAGMLLGAFGFQYIGGLAPCHLCLLQRYPHGLAAAIGVLVALGVSWRPLALLGALSALVTAGIGVYHTGTQLGWWQGPSSCTGFDISKMDPGQLLDAINAAPLVRCDEITWVFLGLTMPAWNAVISVVFAAIWYLAWRGMKPAARG